MQKKKKSAIIELEGYDCAIVFRDGGKDECYIRGSHDIEDRPLYDSEERMYRVLECLNDKRKKEAKLKKS